MAAYAMISSPDKALAAYETGTYQIRSPLNYTQWVTSPSKYHDGAPTCPESNWDSPSFDNTDCRAAGVPTGTATPNWAIDIDAVYQDAVYIDINPSGEDSFAAGSTYRVVAGDIYQWDSSSNGKYQYFGIHTWNPNTSSWENYAWVRVGHLTPTYTTPDTVIISSTTLHQVVQVGTVAAEGTWPDHIHMDFYNYSGYSRSYNWDGPSNANDTGTIGPACIYAGGSASDCNTQVRIFDGVGYVGGTRASFAQIDNPYYVGF